MTATASSRRSERIFFLAAALASAATAPAAMPIKPPPAPPQKSVTETLYGTTIVDPYRYMEKEDAPVIDWMKAEGRYTRAVLDSIPQHEAVLRVLSDFSGSFDIVQGIKKVARQIFYEERSPGSDNFDLLVRDSNGTIRKLVDVAAIRAAAGGKPFAINYFKPSPDGSQVAVGISEGGSDNASIYVYDTRTGVRVAGPLPLARYGFVNWTNDGQALLVNLIDPVAKGEIPIKYTNSKVYLWDLHSQPVALLGNGVPGRISFAPDEIPVIDIERTAPVAFAINARGVQNEIALWTAPVASALKPGAVWAPLVTRDDDVTRITSVGNHIYLLSHKDAPTFDVLEVDAGQPLSAAKVIIAADPARVIKDISAASDALYVGTRRGLYSELLRVPLDGGPAQAIALPFKGSLKELYTDPRVTGATLILDGWVTPPTILSYDPVSGQFADLHLGKPPAGYDAARYVVSDLQARAGDGAEVPLTYVTARSSKHPRPLLLWAYGSYGISTYPEFGTRILAAPLNDLDSAVCHVRGGGELGEAWRLAGKDANKQNTWRDLIACGEDLISRGYTTKKLLFIAGPSAGGIAMGRAMEERPDLFAGVLDLVPLANATRFEFTPAGPNNIPEFGSVKTEQGFRNLYAMDTVLHVKKGVQYPAVMITTGLNDPRVVSWMPAKLAATLQASGTHAPVLLRVDEQAGHGVGTTRSQSDAVYADIVSFIKWRSGEPGWKPQALAK